MAPTKSSRTKDDKTKKRKREVNEADSRSKRQRAERKQNKANGRKVEDALSTPAKGTEKELNGLTGALETTGDRELEVVRQFDDGEAGWRVSKPMGGRMLDIDPILTDDDQ